jgi:hypothetical protein
MARENRLRCLGLASFVGQALRSLLDIGKRVLASNCVFGGMKEAAEVVSYWWLCEFYPAR